MLFRTFWLQRTKMYATAVKKNGKRSVLPEFQNVDTSSYRKCAVSWKSCVTYTDKTQLVRCQRNLTYLSACKYDNDQIQEGHSLCCTQEKFWTNLLCLQSVPRTGFFSETAFMHSWGYMRVFFSYFRWHFCKNKT